MDAAQFANFFSTRPSYIWSLLATAAGDEDTLRRTLLSVEGQQLSAGVNGLGMSPNRVGNAIEAIAARDPKLLTSVTHTWLRPNEISTDMYDDQADFWSVAWTKSIRHLKEIGAVNRSDVETNVYMVSCEVSILWPSVKSTPMSFHEIAQRYFVGEVNYHDLRQFSNQPLTHEEITSEHIRTMCDSSSPSRESLQLLRLVRGRSSLLDVDARAELLNILRAWPEYSWTEIAHVIEVLRELQIPLPREILDQLFEALQSSDELERMFDLALVLISRTWKLP